MQISNFIKNLLYTVCNVFAIKPSDNEDLQSVPIYHDKNVNFYQLQKISKSYNYIVNVEEIVVNDKLFSGKDMLM